MHRVFVHVIADVKQTQAAAVLVNPGQARIFVADKAALLIRCEDPGGFRHYDEHKYAQQETYTPVTMFIHHPTSLII